MIWYSVDERLVTCDRHAVDVNEALAIVHKYVFEVRPHYDTGEKAMAATTFGFSRSDEEFLEICIHSPSEISVIVELPNPWILRLFRGPFHDEEIVRSHDALSERVRQFFTMTPPQLRARLAYDH